MNEYSDKLNKVAEDYWNQIKDGGQITFEITGIRFDKELNRHVVPRRVGVPNTDRIRDPYTKTDIDIGYITGSKPTGPDSQKETQIVLGDIVFFRDDMGRITFRKQYRNWELFRYLFFSNYNKSNVGKEWHYPPNLIHGYRYYMIDRRKNASDKINFVTKRNQAQDLVQELTDNQLEGIAKGLYHDYQMLSKEEIVNRLILKAESNPDYILRVNDDVDIKLKAFIKDAEKAGVIRKNERHKKWEYADTGDFICTIKPGMTPEDNLKNYFLSDSGKEVYDTLKATLSPKKQSKEEDSKQEKAATTKK